MKKIKLVHAEGEITEAVACIMMLTRKKADEIEQAVNEFSEKYYELQSGKNGKLADSAIRPNNYCMPDIYLMLRFMGLNAQRHRGTVADVDGVQIPVPCIAVVNNYQGYTTLGDSTEQKTVVLGRKGKRIMIYDPAIKDTYSGMREDLMNNLWDRISELIWIMPGNGQEHHMHRHHMHNSENLITAPRQRKLGIKTCKYGTY